MSGDRIARAALSRLAEPGDTRLASLVSRLGAATVLDRLRADAAAGAAGGVGGGVGGDLGARLRGLDPERELADAAKKGIRFICPEDAEWPPALADLERAEPLQNRGGAPIGLWAKGPLRLRDAVSRSCAVVGSRSATSYGASVASGIAADLARDGVAVISGAAYGIDQSAHRGALAVKGPTVAVLACGVDRAYPSAHAALLDYIADVGLVLSELPPGCSPTRYRFLSRNRVIAALGQGTVVVEAAVRSGALNTANWTSRLGRVLMGVPGPVTSAPSEGVHQLIRACGASLVTGGGDVLELVSPMGEHLTAAPRAGRRPRDLLTEREQRVLDAVPMVRSATGESIARTAGVEAGEVLATLRQLRGRGFVEESAAGWRLAAAE